MAGADAGWAMDGEVRVVSVGPGDALVVQPEGARRGPLRVRVAVVFGLRGPWTDALLGELLEDVETVRVRSVGRDGAGLWRVEVLPAGARGRCVA